MGYDSDILYAIIERQDRILFEGLSVLPVPPDPSEAPVACSIQKKVNMPLVKEVVVCEVSVNDMLMNDEEAEEANYEEMSAGGLSERELVDRKKLHEEVEFYKRKLEEMQAREEELHQKLMECSQDNSHLRHQVAALTADNANWQRTVLQLFLNEDTLKDDDAKVAYYTGFPSFSVLMQIYELGSEKIPNSTLYVLPKFQQFLLSLMRIRLNLQIQDLGYRFNVSPATVSRVFHKWLPAMTEVLEKYIVWPDRDTIIESTPLSLRKELGEPVGVIISCLEIPVEKSSMVVSKVNSVKFLISMTPNGTIYHASRSFFGDTSVQIVEESSALDKLLPGDVVILDKAFNECCGEWMKACMVESSEGKPQLSSEREVRKNFVNVGFNVEKVSGHLKRKFCVLKSFLNLDYVSKREEEEFSPIDLVVKVCCGIANLCPPAPLD